MKPRVRIRVSQNRVTNTSTPDTAIAARSACCTANVLGATSANVNTTVISNTMPTKTPTAPKVGSSSVPSSVAEIIWHASSTSSTLLSVCSGCSSSRSSRSARLSPSSARFMSRIRLTRTNAVSASAIKADTARSTTITTITMTSEFTTLRPFLRSRESAPAAPARVGASRHPRWVPRGHSRASAARRGRRGVPTRPRRSRCALPPGGSRWPGRRRRRRAGSEIGVGRAFGPRPP